MRILCTVVEPLMRAMFDVRHNLPLGGSVRGEFIGDDALGCHALLLQETLQQALGGLGARRVWTISSST